MEDANCQCHAMHLTVAASKEAQGEEAEERPEKKAKADDSELVSSMLVSW